MTDTFSSQLEWLRRGHGQTMVRERERERERGGKVVNAGIYASILTVKISGTPGVT